tara:strand:+ start:1309 stop:2133 length:825 start_codon:yes stop_codon:yes gene_type:complete
MADEAEIEIAPGSPEYNEQMAEKFNNPTAPEGESEEVVPVPEMPDGGQEKFYNAETGAYDWESHAKELQFNQAGRQKPEAEKEENQELKQPQIEKTEQEVSDVVQAAGLDELALEQKIKQNGDLTEDDYAALAKVGVPEGLARSYVDNLNYRIQGQRAEAYEYAGGEEQWNKMSSWAAENMSDTEVAGLNHMLDSPDWKLAMDAMKSRMGPTLVETEPQFIKGETTVGSSFGYRSKDEMKADMASAEYQKSPAFRAQVMQKMQSATWDLDPDVA